MKNQKIKSYGNRINDLTDQKDEVKRSIEIFQLKNSLSYFFDNKIIDSNDNLQVQFIDMFLIQFTNIYQFFKNSQSQSQRFLDQKRKFKIFQQWGQKYGVWAWSKGEIVIFDLINLEIIQVLQTSFSCEEIECIDIAESTKDIICYGTLNIEGKGEIQKNLVIFGLKDQSYLNGIDQKVTQNMNNYTNGYNLQRPSTQILEWCEYWRCDQNMLAIQGFLNAIAISPFGDTMVLAGNEFLSLWTRDQNNISAHSFTLHLLVAKELPQNIYALNLAQQDMNQIIQCEFTKDGRSFVTLEQINRKSQSRNSKVDCRNSQRIVKIWYNSDLSILPDIKNIQQKKPFFNNNQTDYQQILLRQKNLKLLNYFQLPSHRGSIEYFSILNNDQSKQNQCISLDYNLSQKQLDPIQILTVTNQGQAYIWSEDMSLPPDFFQQIIQDPDIQNNYENSQIDPSNKYLPLTFSCQNTIQIEQKYCKSLAQFSLIQNNWSDEISNDGWSFKHSLLELGQSPILYGKKQDHVLEWKIKMAEKVYEGMSFGDLKISAGKIQYVMCFYDEGKKWKIWQLANSENNPQDMYCQQSVCFKEYKKGDLKLKNFDQNNEVQYFYKSQFLIQVIQEQKQDFQQNINDGLKFFHELSLFQLNQSGGLQKLSLILDQNDNQQEFEILKYIPTNFLKSQKRKNIDCSQSQGFLVNLKQESQYEFKEDILEILSLQPEDLYKQQSFTKQLKHVSFIPVEQKSKVIAFQILEKFPQILVFESIERNLNLKIYSSKILFQILKEFSSNEDIGVININEKYEKYDQNIEKSQIIDYLKNSELLKLNNELNQFVSFKVINAQYLIDNNSQIRTLKQQIDILIILKKSISLYQITIQRSESSIDTLELSSSSECIKTWELRDISESIQSIEEVLAFIQIPQNFKTEGSSDKYCYLQNTMNTKLLIKSQTTKNQYQVNLLTINNQKVSIMESIQSLLPYQFGNQPGTQDFQLDCQLSAQLLTLQFCHQKKQQYHIYLQELQAYEQDQVVGRNKYLGYIDLLKVIEWDPDQDKQQILKQDQGICTSHQILQQKNGTIIIAIACISTLYILGKNSTSQDFEVFRVFKKLFGQLDSRLIRHVKLNLLSNFNFILTLNMNQQTVFSAENIDSYNEKSLCKYSMKLQKSKDLISKDILHFFYVQGKTKFLFKIFIKIASILKAEYQNDNQKQWDKNQILVNNQANLNENDLFKITSKLTLQLKEILNEIQIWVQEKVVQQEIDYNQPTIIEQKPKQKQGGFDDFFGGDDDEDEFDLMDMDNKNNSKIGNLDKQNSQSTSKQQNQLDIPQNSQIDLNIQFEKIKEELLNGIAKVIGSNKVDESNQYYQLLEFIMLFSKIYSKEFFADEISTVLLKMIYIETESINKNEINDLIVKNASSNNLENIKNFGEQMGTKVTKKMEHHEIYAQLYQEQDYFQVKESDLGEGKVSINKLGQWNSQKCALALFSVNQDVILNELQERFDLEQNASWNIIRDICLPVWIKDNSKLRNIVEWISKVAYKIAGDQNVKSASDGQSQYSKAEATSLWYILINKKSLLINLYEKEKSTGGDKVAQMLSQDFTVDRWAKAAQKNAMVLRQKQRFLLSASFFILGDDLQSALQVITQSMNDPVLAILTCRMLLLQIQKYDKKQLDNIQKQMDDIYEYYFIERGSKSHDLYLKSIGYWGQKKYVKAVNILQEKQDIKDQLKISENMFQTDQQYEIQITKNDENKQQKIQQKDLLLPLISDQSGYELLQMIQKLKKSPPVTQALKKDESSTSYGADDFDFYNDFSQSKVQEKKEEKQIEQLEIQESLIVNQMLKNSLKNGNVYQSLFCLREYKEFIDPSDLFQSQQIYQVVSNIMNDQIYDTQSNPYNLQSSIQNQISDIINFCFSINCQDNSKFLKIISVEQIDKEQQFLILKSYFQRVILDQTLSLIKDLEKTSQLQNNEIITKTQIYQQKNQYVGFFTFRYELEQKLKACQYYQKDLKTENGSYLQTIPMLSLNSRSILERIEEQTYTFQQFILNHQASIFLEMSQKDLFNYGLPSYRKLLNDLEIHIDCLIIYEYQDLKIQEEVVPDGCWSIDQLEIWFFGIRNQKEKEESKPQEKKNKLSSPFDDLMGGDDDDDGLDLMDFDFQQPLAQKVNANKNKNGIKPFERMISPYLKLQRNIVLFSSKIRTAIIIYLVMIIICFNTNKFNIFKKLVSAEEFQKFLQAIKQLSLYHEKLKNLKKQILEKKSDIKQMKILQKEKTESHHQNILLQKILKCKQDIQSLKHELMIQVVDIEKIMNLQKSQLHFQSVKTFILKLKYTIEKKTTQYMAINLQEKEDLSKESFEMKIQNVLQDQNQKKYNIYQQKWETDLHIDDKKVQIISQDQTEQANPEYLQKLGKISSESYQFIQMWLRFIMINYTKEIIDLYMGFDNESINLQQAQNNHIHQKYIDYGFEFGLDFQLQNQEQEEWKVFGQNIQNYLLNNEIQSYCLHQMKKQQLEYFNSKHLLSKFSQLNSQLQNQCSLYFKTKLNVIQKHYLARSFKFQNAQNNSKSYKDAAYLVFFKYFFKNMQKQTFFWNSLNVQEKYVNNLYQYFLTLLANSNTSLQNELEFHEQQFYPPKISQPQPIKQVKHQQNQKNADQEINLFSKCSSQVLLGEYLGQGIEIFKQRNEQISDFAIDNTIASDNCAIGLMTQGIREFSILNTLRFRQRIDNGLILGDEENLTWEECLHRYDQYELFLNEFHQSQESNKESFRQQRTLKMLQTQDDSIVMAINSIFSQTDILNQQKTVIQNQVLLNQFDIKIPDLWNGSQSQNYLKETSKLGITHDDPSYAVESHPYLPIYVTGNRKGILCTWMYNQNQEKSLNQFMPEIDPRQADVKKACIKKIMFNQYGDKIMSNNMDGNFTIYQLSCHSKNMRKLPLFSLFGDNEQRINDFDLVNSDNIICTISQKQRVVRMYDTLLPYSYGRQAQILEFKLPQNVKGCGNIILCNQKKQQLYTFNARTGAMTELDMRKNLQQVNQYQLSQSQEITAACLSNSRDSIITGYKDGNIKIHRIDSQFELQEAKDSDKYLQLRDKFNAFQNDNKGKKGTVTKIKISQKTGALFASSQAGILKILRTSV